MRKISKILLIIFLIIIYAYVCNISAIPSNIVVLEGEKLNLKTILGLSLKTNETTLASSNLEKNKVNENTNTVEKLNLELFGNINLKTININIIPKTKVIPIGKTIGMKLYTDGVLVVGTSEINGKNNSKERPYENSGIKEGDTIIQVNENKINNTNELIEAINDSKGNEIKIKYIEDGETYETTISPVETDIDYKLGLWVRDAAAGVGTLTFYEPDTNMFMSLGHGIEDVDTGKIVEISNGELVTANVISIIKGKKDTIGEIRGTISNGSVIGKIYKNTDLGVYGNITNKENIGISTKEEIEVANREEIEKGKATIICQIDNTEPKEYEIEIEKIFINNNYDNKSMLIKVTDSELINKTGGIIQGMSGSPIIQNRKFVGAVTHVLLNNPKEGYAIFGDLMIKQMREVK